MGKRDVDEFEDGPDDEYERERGPSDREDPDESDQDDPGDDDEADTEPCPYCGKPVFEQAEICPHCNSFISFEDAPRRRRPLWVYVGVALCLIPAVMLAC